MKEYIKLWIVLIHRLIIRVFFIFPIKPNRIIFNSFVGKQYSCNPKYISEYLQKYFPDQYEIIWAFNTPDKFRNLEELNIKLCKFKSLRYIYYKTTSKISVTNYSWGTEMPSRKQQFEIQTWHGGGAYKRVGQDNKTILASKAMYRRYQINNMRYSLVLSSSKNFTENTIRNSMGYSGEIMECGMPRNDILINRNAMYLYEKVYTALNIPLGNKIVIYAPTWRKDCGVESYNIDFDHLSKALQEKFSGQWSVLTRYHHEVNTESLKLKNNIIDATSYPDMQELLYASEILITDYSSSIWDFSFTGKPCFLYCPDLNLYKEERDFYRPIDLWGFPISETNEELYQNITEFNRSEYKNALNRHHDDLGSYEIGKATQSVCKRIHDVSQVKKGVSRS